uniref:Uncharacterized protein n=1 Tax=Rhizophora mucronata TaxID=61149 RepID=A0A2P2QSH3_RHIMU
MKQGSKRTKMKMLHLRFQSAVFRNLNQFYIKHSSRCQTSTHKPKISYKNLSYFTANTSSVHVQGYS